MSSRSTAAAGTTIDLAGGSDTLSLLATAANSVNVANVESLLGGTAADTVVLTAPQVGATIDLSSGVDSLTLASGSNSIVIANIESVLGAAGNDTLALSTPITTATYDLAGGTDTVDLSGS